jgi:hypothetical protein
LTGYHRVGAEGPAGWTLYGGFGTKGGLLLSLEHGENHDAVGLYLPDDSVASKIVSLCAPDGSVCGEARLLRLPHHGICLEIHLSETTQDGIRRERTYTARVDYSIGGE